MKKVSKTIGTLVGMSAILAASTAAAALTWSNFVTLSGVDVEAQGTTGVIVWVGSTTAPTNKPACGTAGEYELYGSADAVKAITNTATAAYLAGKQVKLLFDGACDGSYAHVVGVTTF